jgi:hypothetical protein
MPAALLGGSFALNAAEVAQALGQHQEEAAARAMGAAAGPPSGPTGFAKDRRATVRPSSVVAGGLSPGAAAGGPTPSAAAMIRHNQRRQTAFADLLQSF